MRLITGHWKHLLLSALLGWAAGCAHDTRVIDVWMHQKLQVVSSADEEIFLRDRATIIRSEGEFLPPEKQGQDFFATWRGNGIDQVKFEYRQVNRPDSIAAKTITSKPDQHHATFAVIGDEYQQGGAVSSWRVSLWRNGQIIAEKHSSLW